MSLKKQIPNIITSVRLIGAVLLIFITPPFSRLYFAVYTFCGVSDIIDGFIARRFGLQSNFGAKLDSVADIVFFGISLYNIAAFIFNRIPADLWAITAACVALRLISYIVAFLKFHRFASVHTYGNKATGALVFLLPYFMNTTFFFGCCTAVCTIGCLAAIEEIVIHLENENYLPDRKTIFTDTATVGTSPKKQ